ncbi:AraC family transcriptional regulator [Paenibacillus sp. NPDC058174]|uniref:AraC family transcriptional regulator n=1 Tax=Paenibacillus sp. NPDC058174 TaxID=3346366 RepID=UPI0036DD19FA
MDILQLRSNLSSIPMDPAIPFAVYTVGTENQPLMTRLEGYSAHQFFFTFSGTGHFRLLSFDPDSDTGSDSGQWSLIPPGTLLYIPEGLPHEYGPVGEEPWMVGYVTFVEQCYGLLEQYGFGASFFRSKLQETGRLYELLYQLWQQSGRDYDPWRAAELLFAFCLEIKRQLVPEESSAEKLPETSKASRYPHSVVSQATRFLQDHLQRPITVTELSAHVGYSSKQLTRLFRESLDTTPLQYLQRIRLHTAIQLLERHPEMTIRQAAAHVGMEPVYFTRLFRRTFGTTPSAFAAGLSGRQEDDS